MKVCVSVGQVWFGSGSFEALGADCANDGVYEFMLVAPAIPFTGGAGTPVNPIAIK